MATVYGVDWYAGLSFCRVFEWALDWGPQGIVFSVDIGWAAAL